MIKVTNRTLLESQQALQALSETALRGVYALRLADILDEAEARGQKLNELRMDLQSQIEADELSEEEAKEQWEEVLSETYTIDEEPLPQSAVRSAKSVQAGHLMQVRDWLLTENSSSA